MKIAVHHRETERLELKARFESGASVLMLAPRRIGKTWLMNKVQEDLDELGWLCIKIDVEGMRSEDEFLRALCCEIEKTQSLTARVKSQFTHRFVNLTTKVIEGNLAAAIGDIDPREFLEVLIGTLNEEESPTLILVDEISLYINEMAKDEPDQARSLLYHLRKMQQAFPNVCWFLTGSVGLDVVARRHNMLGALLGIDVYSLQPFSAVEAQSYLDELCATGQVPRTFRLDRGSFEYLTRELGWLSPYYLRQIALQLRPTGEKDCEPHRLATAEDIEQAFSNLLSPSQRLHFAAWEEHIDKNFGDTDTRRLRAILDFASSEADGEIHATLLARLSGSGETVTPNELRTLLSYLENDGFLEPAEGRWAFRSGLLRRYWKEYMAND